MAQKVSVEFVSDLSAERGAHTVRFGYEGNDFEIDLTEAEHGTLGAFLATYIAAGRRAVRSGGGRAGSPERAKPQRQDRNAIRTWARTNGFEVNERGRIPAHIQDAYDHGAE